MIIWVAPQSVPRLPSPSSSSRAPSSGAPSYQSQGSQTSWPLSYQISLESPQTSRPQSYQISPGSQASWAQSYQMSLGSQQARTHPISQQSRSSGAPSEPISLGSQATMPMRLAVPFPDSRAHRISQVPRQTDPRPQAEVAEPPTPDAAPGSAELESQNPTGAACSTTDPNRPTMLRPQFRRDPHQEKGSK